MRTAQFRSTWQRDLRAGAAAIAIGFVPAGHAFAFTSGGVQTLYDAASDALPSELPWLWSVNGAGTTAMDPGGLASLTTGLPQQAGFNLFNGPLLDRSAGFRIEFGLRMVSENHTSPNRSGTSLIVLDSQARGIELSFWRDTVFVKNADLAFSQGESRALDTTAERRYTLKFLGDTYQLSTPGVAPLNGAVRNYFADAADNLFEQLVYGQTNYLFFGDNTTSAAASVMLRDVTLAPVPEPSHAALILSGLAILAWRAKRRLRA